MDERDYRIWYFGAKLIDRENDGPLHRQHFPTLLATSASGDEKRGLHGPPHSRFV